MWPTWEQLWFDGRDRHDTLLAEAALRRGGRPTERPDAPMGRVDWGIVAGWWPHQARRSGWARFTVREWRRLALLRWRYRRGRLVE